MPANSTSQLIIAELRRQVDHQISAATATDTKAAGLIAATFALVVLIVPRVRLDTCAQQVTGGATFLTVLGTLLALASAIRPRVEAFSYGPGAEDMEAFLGDPAASLETEMARAFVKVRRQNEDTVKAKSRALITGIVLLIVTVIGLAGMLAAGAIE